MHSIIDFIKNLYDPVYMQGLIHSGGVPLIAAIVFAETGLLVGFFLPGDTMLFIAGRRRGDAGPSGETWLNIWALVPALIAAAIIGDQLRLLSRQQNRPRHFHARGRLFLQAQARGKGARLLPEVRRLGRRAGEVRAGPAHLRALHGRRGRDALQEISLGRFARRRRAGFASSCSSGYILGERAQKNLHYIVLGIALVSMLPVIIGVTKEFLASRKKRPNFDPQTLPLIETCFDRKS